MAKYTWGNGSKRKMKDLDPRLIRVIDRALGYGLMDMSVVCTIRDQPDQDQYFEDGVSDVMWPHSKHNVLKEGDKALAVDVVPWVNGAVSYKVKQCCVLAGILLAAAKEEGVKVRSGSNWDMDGEFITDQKLVDPVHLEIVENKKQIPILVCEDCGKSDDTVEETYCPYERDLNGLDIDVVLCRTCQQLRCEEL